MKKISERKSALVTAILTYLETTPRFTQMCHDSTSLILLDSFRHHIQNIMHNSSSEFKIVVALNTLFGDIFGDS